MINSVTYHLLYVCHFSITSMRTSNVAITPRLKIILTNQLYKINSQFKNSVIFVISVIFVTFVISVIFVIYVTVIDRFFLPTHHVALRNCFYSI
ncbi:hypothetical protein DWQ98_14330 [Staphylococcus aureus]|nr:hypothetical protein D7S39_06725 [Staphylococcus aureus]RDK18078.1 hypothetical protein DWQ95_14605 [Staphylococcus aureus]RDK22288.1 hypothetical protein DWQ73_07585 [Staphylococcus aureus]RDK26652.1 hypothetical protein DWQ98_14330 [Staphylococcus aureus]RDK27614.1 hypothetical protein DWQ82_06295 [Staphylococcus aureus]